MTMLLSTRLESIIKSIYRRHGRRKYGLCACEGERCCRELLTNRPELIEFALCSEDYQGTCAPPALIRVPPKKFRELTNTVSSQGILLVAKVPNLKNSARQAPPPDPFLVILDKISDPGNLGTILRTSLGVGLRELWVTAGSADPFNDKVIRAAMGAQFRLELREFDSLAEAVGELRRYGYQRIFRTDPHQGRNCFREKELFTRSGLIFGSEAQGAAAIPDAIPLHIPMPGNIESLNVAQALTVILFEFVKTTCK